MIRVSQKPLSPVLLWLRSSSLLRMELSFRLYNSCLHRWELSEGGPLVSERELRGNAVKVMGRWWHTPFCHTLSIIVTLYVSCPLYLDILFSLHRYTFVPMPLLRLWTSQQSGDRRLKVFWMLGWKSFQIGLWRVLLSCGLKTVISGDTCVGSWAAFRSC